MKPSRFKRRYIPYIIGVFALALAITVFVFVEVENSKDELMNLVKNESLILIESLNQSISTTFIANDKIEELLINKLISVAELTSINENLNNRNDFINSIKDEFEVSHISILDENLRIINSTYQNIDADYYKLSQLNQELTEFINSEYSSIELGFISDPTENKSIYAVAKKRSKDNGIIITGISANEIIDFRNSIGIGKKIKDIGKNEDVVYVVLQDEQGIFAASEGVSKISSISSDTFLQKALISKKVVSRVIDYKNKKVFEVIKKISINNNLYFLNRIALSLDNVRHIKQSSTKRAILLGIGLFLTGFMVIGLLFLNQRIDLIKSENLKTKAHQAHLLNNLNSAVVTINFDGLITVFNNFAIKLFGFENEFVGKNYFDLFKDDFIGFSLIKNTDSYSEYFEKELQINEKRLFLAINLSVLTNEFGEKDSIIALIYDLTESQKLQEIIKRKEKMTAMGELAAGVAHEIRNPLNAINMIAQRFQFEFMPEEDKDEYLKLVKTIRSEVIRVNKIITQFLDFSKPQKFVKENCNLVDLIESCIDIVNSSAISKQISIKKTYSNEKIYCNIDKDKIKQVFINLLQNSIDAISLRGEINCNISENGTTKIISIEDNGCGINKDDLSKIFNLYYSSKPTGTGLGLAIVHKIITEHNGNIEVSSKVNEGTKFIISFNQ